MSGVSTIIYFTEKFDKQKLLISLKSFAKNYTLLEESSNCFNLLIKEEIQTKYNSSLIEEEASIEYFYKDDFQTLLYSIIDEDVSKEIDKRKDDISFVIIIFFMSNNANTQNYIFKILDRLKVESTYYFLNNIHILDSYPNLHKYILNNCDSLIDTVFLHSDCLNLLQINDEKSSYDLGV